MDYSKIIAITGLPGLFELISSKSDGGIVRSLDDKSTRFVSSRVHQFSHLESIEVYTTKNNVNLVDVLKAMESTKEKLPDDKDAGELKKYFEKVFPELDQERVYTSDLKKMVKWFAVLSKNEVDIKLSEQPAEEPEVVEVKEEKPAKKTAKAEVKSDKKSPEEKKPAKKSPEKVEETKPSKKSPEKAVEVKSAKKTVAKKTEEPVKKSAAKTTEKKSTPKKK
jgi:Domain of unknown function (DUF5606)